VNALNYHDLSEEVFMEGMERRIRVLIAKPGLDGHDRGAKVVARALKDAGMEVIYTGLHQTPDQIVSAAVQESVDVVGLSVLSGAHIALTEKVVKKLKEKQILDDLLLVIGGNIQSKDVELLENMGVNRVFGTGTDLNEIVDHIKNHVRRKEI
jgi:methylmalonyl-CoA mutase C-terminal domain/subunit